MSLPSPNPALPSYPAPYFLDNSFVRGDQMRANNGFIWNNLESLDARITAIEDSVVKTAIDFGTPLAGIVYIPDERATNFTFDPLNPRTYWPAINLSAIESFISVQSIATGGAYPNAFISYLEGVNLKYLPGLSGEVESWSVSVSGVTVTFPNTTSANAVLAAINEDVNASGVDASVFRCLYFQSNGTNYEINTINTVTRQLTMATSPPSGTQTVNIKPYTTTTPGTCRVWGLKGEAIMAPNDPDGYFIMNLRTRGYMQGHLMSVGFGPDSTTGDTTQISLANALATQAPNGTIRTTSTQISNNILKGIITDGTNGTPLIRKITHGPAYTLIPYMWCGG